ncbi:hypothetical protein BDP27DRAFT_1428661 [Rhodocollybia butyracea]|uniref:Uncharacterized protein n=1 Tax=Rhodocollybia butyracea TaxID=206335 RepID=A0A9P5U0C0_9AGAR|nr:hypothetical protein BDP27DRAFT_1428661 [Rhodocollybia butyracea]
MSNRTVVIHEGSDMGDGTWRCSKREGENCVHILAARRYMRKEQNVDSDDEGELEGNEHVHNGTNGIDISTQKQTSQREMRAVFPSAGACASMGESSK